MSSRSNENYDIASYVYLNDSKYFRAKFQIPLSKLPFTWRAPIQPNIDNKLTVLSLIHVSYVNWYEFRNRNGGHIFFLEGIYCYLDRNAHVF